MSHIKTLTVIVSILFITPTTVYVVADTRLWHQKPAHEIPMPMAHESSNHISAVCPSSTAARRVSLSSPARKQMKIAGMIEKVFVYSTGVHSDLSRAISADLVHRSGMQYRVISCDLVRSRVIAL